MVRVETIHTSNPLSASVSSSFQKFLPETRRAITELKRVGIKVLSPARTRKINASRDFVLLAGDKGSPADIERTHLKAISRSDFLYVVNPDGYIGNSVAMEIGFAQCLGIPVFSLEKPTDTLFRQMIRYGLPISRIPRILRSKRGSQEIPETLTVSRLQSFLRTYVREKGFQGETVRDALLLLTEEVGELANAVRVLSGMKVREGSIHRLPDLRDELADCFIYLLDIANLTNIDIDQAVRGKLGKDSSKRWIAAKSRI